MVQEETKQVRNSIKINDKLKKPLLLDKFEFDEEEEDRKRNVMEMMSSPRVLSSKLTTAGGQQKAMRKMTVSRQLTMKVDKFASGQKKELLDQQKRDEERKQRELEDLRNRDLNDLKSALGANCAKNVIMP